MASVADPVSVVLPMDRETGRPRGFAFVDYADIEAATEVIRRLNGNLFLGRTLSVSEARPREERVPRPPMGGGPGGPPRMGPALGGPPRMGPPAGPGGRERNFGPPAPPKGRRSAAGKPRGEGGPKGPIKVRGGGRVFDVDEAEDEALNSVEFDDVATSRQAEDESEPGNE